MSQEQAPLVEPTAEILDQLEQIKKKTVSGALSYFLRTLILQGIGLFSIFLLSAYFSPEDFGIYGFVIQIIGILIFFSDVGLAAALVQKKSNPTNREYQTAFSVQQLLSWLIVLIILAILATGFVQQKTGQAGVWILLSLGISFPLATLKTIPSVILERKLQFSKLVIPQIFEQFVFHGILIFLAVRGVGVASYAYAIFARSVIGVIVMTYIQPWPFGFALHKKDLKTLLGFGFKFQLNDFLARIKDQLFYLVLGAFLPLRQFGYIQWAKNWSLYPYNLTVQNVMAITFPTFSRLQGHELALRRAIEKSLFFITLLMFPMVIGMSLFIIPFVQLVPEYNKWLPAAASFIFFSLSIGWSAISTPLTNTLNALGKINTTLKLMVMWTSLTWILTPLFIWWFDYHGVALAALVIGTTSVLPVWYVQRIVPFDFWDQIWRQLVGGIVMALIGAFGLALWSRSYMLFATGIMLTSGGYLLTVFALGRKKVLAESASILRKMR